MKKTCLLFLICAMLPLSLFGCNRQAEEPDFIRLAENDPHAPFGDVDYPCYYQDGTNNTEGFPEDVETYFWSRERTEPTEAQKTARFTFDGKEYIGTATMQYSVLSAPFSAVSYRTENGEEFDLRADDGRLVYIDLMGKDFFKRECAATRLDNVDAATEEIARKCVSPYINTENYTLSSVKKETVTEENGSFDIYEYLFVKMIGNIATADTAKVRITSSGTVASVTLGDIDAFDAVTEDMISLDAANASIAKAMSQIYSNSNYILRDYQLDSQYIAFADNGELVLCSYITYDLQARRKGGTDKTGQRLLVTQLPIRLADKS